MLVANVETPEAGVPRLGLFVVVFEELPPPDTVVGHVVEGDDELLALRILLMYDVRLKKRSIISHKHSKHSYHVL